MHLEREAVKISHTSLKVHKINVITFKTMNMHLKRSW